MNATCPDCALEYAMQQEALDRLGCMFCNWDGTNTEKRPASPPRDSQAAETETPTNEESSAMSHSTADHTDLDRLSRLAETIRDYQATEPLSPDDLDGPTVADVEELAYRFNVLPTTVLYVAELLADDEDDICIMDVFHIFDTARHDAQQAGLKLPLDARRTEAV